MDVKGSNPNRLSKGVEKVQIVTKTIRSCGKYSLKHFKADGIVSKYDFLSNALPNSSDGIFYQTAPTSVIHFPLITNFSILYCMFSFQVSKLSQAVQESQSSLPSRAAWVWKRAQVLLPILLLQIQTKRRFQGPPSCNAPRSMQCSDLAETRQVILPPFFHGLRKIVNT